jgi:hypothetical protein
LSYILVNAERLRKNDKETTESLLKSYFESLDNLKNNLQPEIISNETVHFIDANYNHYDVKVSDIIATIVGKLDATTDDKSKITFSTDTIIIQTTNKC